ncbi:hypothetical protein P8629_12770, partial [Hydrogenovibrio sp. 3SP14C1]|uniref:hypothetical protein n=1 Tax=Hydrogenovibrio sp. 3SP14C1 TaxID=3038774 RepID=UPI003FA5DB19|nr:hypothetical protein [Hydrogenovibrio sp. 3SP14C1]
MAEQEAAEQTEATEEPAPEAPQAKPASDDVFRPLSGEPSCCGTRDLEMIMDIPVKLTVSLVRPSSTVS